MRAMKKYTVGVDTSNYTTSLSLICDGLVLANVRRLLPVKSGEKGLRQSDAVFLHTKALPDLSKELFSRFDFEEGEIEAVGVSTKPRDEEGSYMPCFLAGVSFASAISYSHNIPLYEFSHQAGHIASAVYSCGKDEEYFTSKPFISFHISGGTTEALLTEFYESTYSCKIIGGTKDASCGQMIDRSGVMMGLDFPCGKALDELSKGSKKTLDIKTNEKDGYFSMSGLQNKAEKYFSEGEAKEDIALFLFRSIARSIKKSTESLRKTYGNLPVLYAGGVMANSYIRKELSCLDKVFFASSDLSSDNAVGIGLLAYKQTTKGNI